MARIRQIKPEFFKSEDVSGLEPFARLLFIGLWTLADREGRLLDRPRRIAIELFPYDRLDDQIESLLALLAARALIERYEAGGRPCIQIKSFAKHQKPHIKEPPSELPGKPGPARDKSVPVPHIQTKPGFAGASTNPAPTQHLPSRSGSGSLGSGSLGAGSGARAIPDAPTTTPGNGRRWSSQDWLDRFVIAWNQAHPARHYGMTSDGKALGTLEDHLAALPNDQVVAAQGRCAEMLREFLEDQDQKLVKERHPFVFFVARFGGLRNAPVEKSNGSGWKESSVPRGPDTW